MLMGKIADGFSPSSLSWANTFAECSLKKTPTSLAATLSFDGDSRASMSWNAPAESVQEFLQSPASDFDLMGTKDAKQQPSSNLWDCRQPRIDFLGIDLVPILVNNVKRAPPDAVTVSIIEARTEIAGTPSPANRVVASLLEKSKFVGKSRVRARKEGRGSACTVSVDLNLKLEVPLPPFMLLPPGFNSLGSAIIGQTGKTRTKQFLTSLKQAYEKWAAEKQREESQTQES
jgi:hypothetical protein